MTFEAGPGTDSQQSSSGSGSGFSWGGALQSALPPALQLGLPLAGGFGSGLMHPTQHQEQGQDAAPKEVGKKDNNSQAPADAQASVQANQKKEAQPPTRAELMANPKKYGMPDGMNAAQFANQYADEYLAKLAYKDPTAKADDPNAPAPGYSNADKKFLSDWGYKFSTDVRDAKSGLYVAKFDPVDPKSGIAPVVAFRGTEGGSPDTRETLKDVQADASYSYIGQNQYESKKAEIAALFQDKNGQKVDVTGHSLGGALAQKAVVDNMARTRGLTTFQAPGILQTDADKFAQENKKYGIDVNHHYVTTDLVHRAGEAKLGGNFWEHTLNDDKGNPLKGPDQLGGIKLPHSIDDIKRDLALGKDIGAGIGTSHTTHDLLGGSNQTITKHATDPQTDRAKWEGLRKEAGKRINSTNAFDVAQDVLNAKQHLNNVGGAWQAGKDQAGQAWNQGVAGAKDGVSEAGHGFSDLAHLNVKKGLSEIGHGLGSGVGNLVGGGWGFAKNLFGGAKNAGGELLDAGGDAIQAAKDLKNGAGGIKNLVKEGVGFVKDHKSEILGSAKDLAIDELHQLEKGPAGPAIQGAKSAYNHGKSAISEVGAAGTSLKNGLTGAASSAGAGIQGAIGGAQQTGHGLSELAHLEVRKGLSDIGGGIKNGVSSAVHSGAGVASSLWNGATGAVSHAGGALSQAKSAAGGLLDSAKGVFGLFGHHSK